MNRVLLSAQMPRSTYGIQETIRNEASAFNEFVSSTESILRNHAEMLEMLQRRLNEIDQYCIWVASTYPEIPQQYNALTDIGATT